MKPPKPIYSYLSAAALAVVTVVTFFVFQNFGPQSAVRRFHEDVATQNIRDLNQIVVASLRQPAKGDSEAEKMEHAATLALFSAVNQFAQNNVSYEIVGVARINRGKAAKVTVEYVSENGRMISLPWYVLQTPGDWKIDGAQTLQWPLPKEGNR